jgi:YD repeat-containing protein
VRKTILRCCTTLLLVIVLIASQLAAMAQQGGTTTYVYDDNGRLHAVISPAGDAEVYEYDAAGNITAIRRVAANSLAILAFSPHEGLPGDQVTFTGVGFGGGVNNVSFNGASASIVSFTASQVVAIVPPTATTGLITITTPTGSVSTTTPFTISGLRITPSFAAVYFGGSVAFTAEVFPSTLDQNVQWSVEGINGGNTTVGTISAAGFYTAPNTRFSSVTIRATSVADSARFGEAHVKVSDPNDVQSVFASAVSVSRGQPFKIVALTSQVAVQFGISSVSQSTLSSAVSVQRGIGGGQTTALAQQVSIQREDSLGQYSAVAAVSATRGPEIQSISPGSVTRGTSVTLTVNGMGFTGATAIRFITAGGANDITITASNIVVSADGTSLTATLTVTGSSPLGSRIVIISTPNGDTRTVDLGVNKFDVQ